MYPVAPDTAAQLSVVLVDVIADAANADGMPHMFCAVVKFAEVVKSLVIVAEHFVST